MHCCRHALDILSANNSQNGSITSSNKKSISKTLKRSASETSNESIRSTSSSSNSSELQLNIITKVEEIDETNQSNRDVPGETKDEEEDVIEIITKC